MKRRWVTNAASPRMFPEWPNIDSRVLRMISKGYQNRYVPLTEARRVSDRFFGFGATDKYGRYLPTAAEILDYPTPGHWYRYGAYKNNTNESYVGIAKRAYGDTNFKKGLMLMNNATWNDQISHKTKGWEAYKVAGLQSTPDYSGPRTKVLSGHEYPIVWIPPLTGEEPEEMGFQDVSSPTPVSPTPIYAEPEPTPTPAKPVTSVPTTPGVGPMGPQGPIGPMGPQGPQGVPGAIGPMGPAGPPGEATSSAIMAAVQQYLNAHPPQGGPPGPMGPMGPKGDPGEATGAAIMAAVSQYLAQNPPPAGPPGPMGPQGPKGVSAASSEGGGKSGMWTLPLAALLATL